MLKKNLCAYPVWQPESFAKQPIVFKIHREIGGLCTERTFSCAPFTRIYIFVGVHPRVMAFLRSIVSSNQTSLVSRAILLSSAPSSVRASIQRASNGQLLYLSNLSRSETVAIQQRCFNTSSKRELNTSNNDCETAKLKVASGALGATTHDAPAQRDPLDVSFNDPIAAFKSKTTWELMRAYFVYIMCSSEYLVENNMKVNERGADNGARISNIRIYNNGYEYDLLIFRRVSYYSAITALIYSIVQRMTHAYDSRKCVRV